ncbi:hypothetical protein [Enterobacter ludwigii]|uniref:hypothetical protein n=1 Tax=Enterobacter ludwigii TaxID=299767 RepID=UPI003D6DB596
MKYLSLQQAMLGMRVIMTDDGLILKSPAGSAHYDLKGRRHTVLGDASFFPEHMRVKDKRKPNLSRIVFEKDCKTIYGADGKAQVRIGNWENPEKPKGFRIHADGPLTVNHGQAFIDNALVGGSVMSANYNVKLNVTDKGKSHDAGMTVGVEDGQNKVVFKADLFHVNEPAKSIIENAVATSTRVKAALSDEMTQAVIDAVRESDLFTALQSNIDAQTASIIGLQQAMHDAVRDAIRNAMMPGGEIWSVLVSRSGRLDV